MIHEKKLIEELSKDKEYDTNERCVFLGKVFEESFDKVTEEFITHPAVQKFFSSLLILTSSSTEIRELEKFSILCLYIAGYLKNKEKLELVETSLKDYLKITITWQKKASGTSIFPLKLANQKIIKNIFLADDEKLSRLFLKHIPKPRAYLFKGHTLPKILDDPIINPTSINKRALQKEFELKYIIKPQRRFRKKQRMREESQRIVDKYPLEDAKKFIENANTKYIPLCGSKLLSKRILAAAEKVELFSSVKHLTTENALEDIFNNGLYGRRTLLNFYMFFKPASLYPCDVEQGDGNVICLGARKIDINTAVELEFDSVKISKDNPCVFYKQRDMGFPFQELHRVREKDFFVCFFHPQTHQERYGPIMTKLVLCNPSGRAISQAFIANEYLISYNVKEMQQILTLNFFRFIDTLKLTDSYKEDKESKQTIYDELSKLTDKQLVEALQKIGTCMIETMEFNIYGAYKIDFDALKTVKIKSKSSSEPSYVLELKSLIAELQMGKLEMIKKAMEKIPQIFNSYRFIDYLLSKVEHELAIHVLQMQRRTCALPTWLEEVKTVHQLS